MSESRKASENHDESRKALERVGANRKASEGVGASRKARGDLGEEIAARYLSKRGFAILDKQWKCRYGELDLIAREASGIICFVEVKLRKRSGIASGREAVDGRKRERLRKAAALWLSERDPDALTRFDVAEIRADPNGFFRLEYLPDAFS